MLDENFYLPPPYTFRRPYYMYDYVPDGWLILRIRLFGETFLLMNELEGRGHIHLSEREMRGLLYHYDLNPHLVPELVALSQQYTLADLAGIYQAWEDERFAAYRAKYDALYSLRL